METESITFLLRLVSTILNPLHDGYPLPEIRERMVQFLALAEELKQDIHANTVKIKLQGILNLMDLDDATTEMNGTVWGHNDGDERNVVPDMDTFDVNVHFMTTLLLVYFREYDKAAELFMTHGDAQAKAFPGLLDGMYARYRDVCNGSEHQEQKVQTTCQQCPQKNQSIDQTR